MQSVEEVAEKRPVHEVVAAAADAERTGKKSDLSNVEQADALAWFLSDTDSTPMEHTFQINVGSLKNKKWVDWTVKPVDMDRLRRIRKQSQSSDRRARFTGNQDYDEVNANVAIVVEGTVSPDLRAASKQIGTVDPAIAVRSRFQHKPGLLAQIAGEIMAISGYDDDDVREVDAAQG
jgi:hypothetical protein